tara:strand:+ start:199 stop:438 length:240 start_codon:yes stop_codon:yes gene_type:complete
MIDRRIDLAHLEEDGLMEDLNWSIARFEQVEKLVKRMTAELKRCYKEIDEVEYRLEMAEDVLGRSDWNSVYRELIDASE